MKIRKPSARKLNRKFRKFREFFNLKTKAKFIDAQCTSDKQLLKNIITKLRPVSIKQGLIRIGGDGDGGYLVPNDMDGIEACFSPGVSYTADFEEMIAKDYGIKSFLADYSVDNPPLNSDFFDFEKKFLGDKNDDVFMRLEDWMKRKVDLTSDSDFLLQMDIEGGEFPVLMDASRETLKKFRMLVIEFHDMQEMFDKDQLPRFINVFEKLLTDFTVVHIHPNNCCPVYKDGDIQIPCTFEVTFYRNDKVVRDDKKLSFPHILDFENVKANEDFTLPKIWQG